MKVGALEEEREALAQHLEHMQQALDAAKEQGASLHSATASRNFPAAFLSPATRCPCCQNSLACLLFRQTALLAVVHVLHEHVLRRHHSFVWDLA